MDKNRLKYFLFNTKYPECLTIFCISLFIFLIIFLSQLRPHGNDSCAKCKQRLDNLRLALCQYHEEYKCFPPAYIADENGTPLHSWRVLVLPYFGYVDYCGYDFSEPWDGPNNIKLTQKDPFAVPLFHCPSDHSHECDTSYLMIIGDKCLSNGANSLSKTDIKNPLNTMLVLIEVNNSDIKWTEPRDFPIENILNGIQNPSISNPFLSASSNHREGWTRCIGVVTLTNAHLIPTKSNAMLLKSMSEIDNTVDIRIKKRGIITKFFMKKER